MNYEAIRPDIRTGDVMLFKGNGIFEKLIRVFTAEGFNHVGLFVWLSDGDLWLAEMKTSGYSLQRASQIVDSDSRLLWVGAPNGAYRPDKVDAMREAILAAKGSRYGFLSLLKVWLSQVTRKRYGVHSRVCSTFVQEVWKIGGITLPRTADPGDIAEKCSTLTKIER